MRAAVYTRYGPPDVVEVREVEKPVPTGDEVLIRVRAASVNPLDWRIMRGVPWVFRVLFRIPTPNAERPARMGRDVAGRVEGVGANVTRFKPGDEVFGWCRGAFAEHACPSESTLALKPASVTFEHAASVAIAGLTALQSLRDRGRVQPGHDVLVNGAAGGLGTFAVQIAKNLGAAVTGVCSTKNVELVRSLGAGRVIDYTREDVGSSGGRYDVVLDNVGNLSMSASRRLLKPRGVCVIAGAPKNAARMIGPAIAGPVLSRLGSRKLGMFMAKLKKEDLAVMGELMATGKVRAVIDRSYPLSEVREALRYLEEGHARGKVVVTMD